MKKLLLLLTLLSTTVLAFAQQGTLAGQVKDKKTGEPVIGAVVFITGSAKGSTTDVEGNYSIPLDAGVYKITASYVSYKPQTFESVQINAGKTTTLNITIEEATTELGSVTITGTRQTNTDISLIKELKQSELVVSGVSGEQIAKSLDRDAAETVRRIPGVTVMNDRYIVIRGMAERYNTVMLNDAFTPSTETDVKSFSFDLLPTSVIDRIMIFKSGSPELPGDFGGGVIKVYTKSVATENSTTIGVSGSYRGNTTLQNFYSYNGGKTDFLGFDDGTRNLPSAFPTNNVNSLNNNDLINLGKSLPNSWGAQQNKALPDLRLSLGLSRNFDIGDIQLSNISAVSYSNTRLHTKGSRTRYLQFDPTTKKSGIAYDYEDELSNLNARLGVVHNWTARFNANNKIEFRNLFNQLGSSQVLNRSGLSRIELADQKNYSYRYESRTLYSGQLQGTHTLPNDKTTFTWTGGYAYTNRNEPDYRRVRTQRAENTNDPFLIVTKSTPSLLEAGRFYSKLDENSVSLNSQIEHRFNPADSTSENAPKIRAGFYLERKKRDFAARYFSISPDVDEFFDTRLLTLPIGQAFAPENFRPQTGWKITEGTQRNDQYNAANTYIAGFVSGTLPISERLTASGGIRLEHNIQTLETPLEQVEKPITRPLPSLNLTYAFNQRSLLRFGSSISLNRPEFREIAPFTYFDFENLWEISGNTALKTASIYNTDLRYEFYPNPTEQITFGVFGKYFVNSIERYFENTSAGNAISYLNSENAYNFGVETEIRKSLLDVSAIPFIQNMSVVLNASLIKSQVKFIDDEGNVIKRPLTGQSPYIINSGFYYQDDKKGLQLTLLYNVVGPRIFVVGSKINPTVYDMPRHGIDVSFTKALGQRFEIKGGIQDILNQKVRLIQDSDNNQKINSVDETVQSLKRGSYSTIGISYKL
ncbi:MAG: TonB-dependent receptor [uncultured Adhaeribacter sp.]|uniref:TonB-dependent receptor n=1 Tax=uncultured Adhaeribacter sp. TaxID=448109 RepID=A0A6J4JKH1_9BACT|nr:MAG: TonB-dependent receptor [uncultured Adhaeribacter sp.]